MEKSKNISIDPFEEMCNLYEQLCERDLVLRTTGFDDYEELPNILINIVHISMKMISICKSQIEKDEIKLGLYNKYTIINNETGQPVEGDYFVLKPTNDESAREAIRTYAWHTPNQELSMDLFKWLITLATEDGHKLDKLLEQKKLKQLQEANPL